MDKAQIIQLLGSALAIGLMVLLAGWARIARPMPRLTAQGARDLLAVEFPDEPVDAVWIDGDGAGLVARSGDQALVLWRKGDGYVAREAPLSRLSEARLVDGRVRLKLGDGAPRLAVPNGVWPPLELRA
ncbi:MAG: hypothetical protein J7521_18495 [Caulobacter sp.]|nr:hypothetical protein [Caulobacter sp.]